MQVSHETIYRTLFIQSRGALRKELTAYLRTGRVIRRPAGTRLPDGRGGRPGILNISERPAEADDRAVPGHWEGDLVFGKRMSPVATLVERSTRFVMLVALPNGHKADLVADALAAKITTLPAALTRTLTWDQGHEMAEHVRFTQATGVEVYFCDPKSPWQRGSNENTNGLLRQYLPRTQDFRTLTQADFDAIADELNGRPRRPSASRHHHKHWPRCCADRLSPQSVRSVRPCRCPCSDLPMSGPSAGSVRRARGSLRCPRILRGELPPRGQGAGARLLWVLGVGDQGHAVGVPGAERQGCVRCAVGYTPRGELLELAG
jgi:hypothetical protein